MSSSLCRIVCVAVLIYCQVEYVIACKSVNISPNGSDILQLEENRVTNISISISPALVNTTYIYLYPSKPKHNEEKTCIKIPPWVRINSGDTSTHLITVNGIEAGTTVISYNTSSLEINSSDIAHTHVTVVRSSALSIISQIIGWIGFSAWSLEFYPQAWKNFQRKSTAGFSHDGVAIDFSGYIAYFIYNVSLYFFLYDNFHTDYPDDILPIAISDAVFSIHSLLILSLLTYQCIFYDKGGQKFSWACRAMLGCFFVYAVVCLSLGAAGVVDMVRAVTFVSYIKIAVNMTRFGPQVLENYRNKSTAGYSLGLLFLDIVGGLGFELQILLLAINTNDYYLLVIDITKVLMPLFALTYDAIMTTQTFCIYRKNNRRLSYTLIKGEDNLEYPVPNPDGDVLHDDVVIQ